VAVGVVREWHAEDGWGVIDSDETPGGCWAHFSVLDVPGFRAISVGQRVSFTYRATLQDGYQYRAKRVQPTGASAPPSPEPRASSSYHSSVSISWDRQAE
jgi:CspA family cold shock protein